MEIVLPPREQLARFPVEHVELIVDQRERECAEVGMTAVQSMSIVADRHIEVGVTIVEDQIERPGFISYDDALFSKAPAGKLAMRLTSLPIVRRRDVLELDRIVQKQKDKGADEAALERLLTQGYSARIRQGPSGLANTREGRALVSIAKSDPVSIAAHELAHLVGLKNSLSDTSNPKNTAHCISSRCTMNSFQRPGHSMCGCCSSELSAYIDGSLLPYEVPKKKWRISKLR